MGQFIVSARKYRPGSFETLLGQENIARTLKNSIIRNQLAHAYLFCGPRGVGKTSAARIFAKTINCSNPGPDMEPCGQCESCRSFAEGRSYNIHELDAASNNSVDDIRQLTDTVRIPPQVGRYSVYIIDEVHMLTQSAFNAFLKTLEEPPAHAIFILATTEKHKILPTILSRCQTYDFNRITIDDIVRNIRQIAQAEGVSITDDAMHIIAQKADGAMRDALTLFDQTVAFCGKEVTYEQVVKNLNVLDYEYYFRLTDCFLSGDCAAALLIFDEIISNGFNSLSFIGGLSSHFRDLIVCSKGAGSTLLELAPSIAQRYQEYSQKCSPRFLFEALEISSECEASYKQSGNPRLLIEFALMKMSNLGGAFAAAGASVAVAAAQPVPVVPKPVEKQPAAPEPVPEKAEPAASAPAAPAAPSAPAAPQMAAKRSSLSIKELMAEGDEKPSQGPVVKEAVKVVTIDAAALQEAWTALAESEAKMPRLSSAISQATPTVEDGTRVHFEVSNAAQKEWIDRNCRARLEAFLQKRLSCDDLRLFVDVAEIKVERDQLYMPSDKVDYLMKTSPDFRRMRKDLGLENA
ncbi:MAG: DNA polymerase III subunit gamma/tau [Bacteroidales bacterium]|nr:DNA polymerase III subunit gamma/tau [Candidatus Cacconaster merdequi]